MPGIRAAPFPLQQGKRRRPPTFWRALAGGGLRTMTSIVGFDRATLDITGKDAGIPRFTPPSMNVDGSKEKANGTRYLGNGDR